VYAQCIDSFKWITTMDYEYSVENKFCFMPKYTFNKLADIVLVMLVTASFSVQ